MINNCQGNMMDARDIYSIAILIMLGLLMVIKNMLPEKQYTTRM